jgi:hypothetical protein
MALSAGSRPEIPMLKLYADYGENMNVVFQKAWE